MSVFVQQQASLIDSSRWAQNVITAHDARLFQYFPAKYRDDEKVVMLAVKHFPGNLQYAGDRCRRLEHVVSLAVKRDSSLFKYAHGDLKENRTYVRSLIKSCKDCDPILQNISNNLREDFGIFDIAVEKSSRALSFAGKKLKQNKQLLFTALKYFYQAAEFFDEDLTTNDRKFVLRAVKINGLSLKFFPNWKSDVKVASAAFKQDRFSCKYLDKKILENPAMIKVSVDQMAHVLELMSLKENI